jgi:hypothetical protein
MDSKYSRKLVIKSNTKKEPVDNFFTIQPQDLQYGNHCHRVRAFLTETDG